MNTRMRTKQINVESTPVGGPVTPSKKGTLVLKVVTLTAVLVLASSAAFAQFETDHFKCYLPTATTPIPAQKVQLQDQFMANSAKVRTIWRFCNPTVKEHNGVVTPIMNPDAHLALHRAGPQPVVNREVQIRNQFGDQTIVTGQARYLAVPTQKDPHGPATNLDHFNCYAVTNSLPAGAQVNLTDQWFASPHKVAKPALFCNPVEKVHNQVVTPIIHPNDHLTCYKITPRAFDKTVQLHNQFGDPQFLSQRADMLCVPTQKLQWKVIP